MSRPFPHQVLAALERPRLVELAAALRITRPAERPTRALIGLLSTADPCEFHDLLRRLSVVEARRICAAYDLPAGGDLDELIAVLEQREPLRPALGVPAPAATERPKDPVAALWQTAGQLRPDPHPDEPRLIIFGLLFLKFAADAGPPLRIADARPWGRGFRLQADAQWPALLARARAPALGARLDRAITALVTAHPDLDAILPRVYRRPGLDPALLAELMEGIDALSAEARHHVLTRASATPPELADLLLALLAPERGCLYDPACGRGDLLAAAPLDRGLRLLGQEACPNAWRLAHIGLILRDRVADLGPVPADPLLRDLHPGLRAEWIVARASRPRPRALPTPADDPRFRLGLPADAGHDLALVQHVLYHLAPRGRAALVLPAARLGARCHAATLRRALVDADLVDAIVALPPRLLAPDPPASLWLLAPHRPARRGRVLMLDAPAHAFAEVTALYHTWREEHDSLDMFLVPGRSRAVPRDELAAADDDLTPGRYLAPAPRPAGPPDLSRLP